MNGYLQKKKILLVDDEVEVKVDEQLALQRELRELILSEKAAKEAAEKEAKLAASRRLPNSSAKKTTPCWKARGGQGSGRKCTLVHLPKGYEGEALPLLKGKVRCGRFKRAYSRWRYKITFRRTKCDRR